MWGSLDKFGKILAIMVICFSICFVILTIPYYVAIADAAQGKTASDEGTTTASIVLWVLSALVLCIVAACGLYGSIRSHEQCLQIFGLVQIVMWIFGLIQMILYYVTVTRCDQEVPLFVGSPFDSICDASIDDLWFWIPNIILMFINACAAFAACGMKYKVSLTNPDIGGGKGEYFG